MDIQSLEFVESVYYTMGNRIMKKRFNLVFAMTELVIKSSIYLKWYYAQFSLQKFGCN